MQFYIRPSYICYALLSYIVILLQSEVDYRRFCGSQPDLSGLHFTECLLYTSKLEETLSEGDRYQPSVEGTVTCSITCVQGTLWWEDTLWSGDIFPKRCLIFPMLKNLWWRDTCHVKTFSLRYRGVPWRQILFYSGLWLMQHLLSKDSIWWTISSKLCLIKRGATVYIIIINTSDYLSLWIRIIVLCWLHVAMWFDSYTLCAMNEQSAHLIKYINWKFQYNNICYMCSILELCVGFYWWI